MSRATLAETLPPTAREIAVLLASTPSVHDVHPGVLHQLLEFAHRYVTQVLQDAQVFADHAGRQSTIEIDDVVLAVQARVGWEFGGRVPMEYLYSLATHTNSTPLPPVPEVFGVRLPPSQDTLTSVDFDLVPHKPPPNVNMYEEEVEEVEESESEEDAEDVEAPAMPPRTEVPTQPSREPAPSTIQMPVTAGGTEEDSDAGDEDDGLFAGGDDEVEEEEESGVDEAMEEVPVSTVPANVNGLKRKLVEDEEYD